MFCKDPEIEEITPKEDKIIESMYWDLPESILNGWRPFTAILDKSLFWGPDLHGGHGLDLVKNLVNFWHGPRGASKTCSMSFSKAKMLRAGKPIWTNYPISFYVNETDHPLTGKESDEYFRTGYCSWMNKDKNISYYESRPLDMDKFYTFNTELRNGGVGIDELQYFVEARTSGREQNRYAGYQIMQIRKTSNSFFYTVQDPAWVDKRFGWSADVECECADIARMPYDWKQLGRKLKEGEITQWILRDLSGVLTGIPFKKNHRDIGPYQFEASRFWNIYPTHLIIDVFQAVNSMKSVKEKERTEKSTRLNDAIAQVATEYINEGEYLIPTKEFSAKVQKIYGEEINNRTIGQSMAVIGIEVRHKSKGYFYDLEPLTQKDPDVINAN